MSAEPKKKILKFQKKAHVSILTTASILETFPRKQVSILENNTDHPT